MEAAPEGGADEKELALLVSGEQSNLEPYLLAMREYLSFSNQKNPALCLDRSTMRMAKVFLYWNGQLFKRTPLEPKIVVEIHDWYPVLELFHDEIGHWDTETTRVFVVDRFWWPSLGSDVSKFVRSCVRCQKSKPIPKYRTTLRIPLTGLFDTFSMDLAGPLPLGENEEKYLLLVVEHLTGWPIVRITTRDTSDVVFSFVQEEIVFCIGPPLYIVSDNARCFTASRVQAFMQNIGIEWKTILQYAPMSNGRAERMVRTIKKGMKQAVFRSDAAWPTVVNQVVYGYRRRTLPGQQSPFFLMYGVHLRLCAADPKPFLNDPANLACRCYETLAVQSHRAAKGASSSKLMHSNNKVLHYSVDDMV